MNLLSNLLVRQKLLALGALLVLSVVWGITQFYSLINERDIAPAARTIQGVELNQELIKVQQKFGVFNLDVARTLAGDGSADFAASGKAAIEAYDAFKGKLETAFGADEAKSTLTPIEGNLQLLRS